MIRRLVVVPPVPALLPRYASQHDPVADLRRSAVAVVRAMVGDAEAVAVVGDDPFAGPVARALLDAAGVTAEIRDDADVVLALANGSAKRSQQAPGHLDERAFELDDHVDRALRSGDPRRLAALDTSLAEDLWTSGLTSLAVLGARMDRTWTVSVPYADAPYGVLWWVAAWVRD